MVILRKYASSDDIMDLPGYELPGQIIVVGERESDEISRSSLQLVLNTEFPLKWQKQISGLFSTINPIKKCYNGGGIHFDSVELGLTC